MSGLPAGKSLTDKGIPTVGRPCGKAAGEQKCASCQDSSTSTSRMPYCQTANNLGRRSAGTANNALGWYSLPNFGNPYASTMGKRKSPGAARRCDGLVLQMPV